MSFVSSSLLLNLVETDNLFRPIILDGVKGSGPLCDYSTTMTLTRSTTYKQSSMQISTAIIPITLITFRLACLRSHSFPSLPASKLPPPTRIPVYAHLASERRTMVDRDFQRSFAIFPGRSANLTGLILHRRRTSITCGLDPSVFFSPLPRLLMQRSLPTSFGRKPSARGLRQALLF